MSTFDIFSGGYVSVFMHSDIKNVDLGSEAYKELPEVSAFPETGTSRSSIDVPNFSSAYNRKLVGRASTPDITLKFNYIPKSEHDKLIECANNGTRVQIKIEYYTDATKKSGLAIAYNGFISSDKMTGDAEAVVGREMTFVVDGGAVAQKVFTADEPLKPTHLNLVKEK
ncbi:TPA: hypothetical protein SMP26_001874 [Proteus mirabilis]|nr:hypothetical protein [Proteus mirabilis]